MWQGYQSEDFVATVDLGRVQPLDRVGASFLQDMRSWIWMPTTLVVLASEDGHTFREVVRISNEVPDDQEGVFQRDFAIDLDGSPVRALRFQHGDEVHQLGHLLAQVMAQSPQGSRIGNQREALEASLAGALGD